MKTNEPGAAPPVSEDQNQSPIAASLRLIEAKLACILVSAMDAIMTVDVDEPLPQRARRDEDRGRGFERRIVLTTGREARV